MPDAILPIPNIEAERLGAVVEDTAKFSNATQIVCKRQENGKWIVTATNEEKS